MAARLTLPTIEKGATYNHVLYWKDKTKTPINLTGVTAKMQVRETVESSTVLVELSTENSGIIIVPLEGKITLHLSAVQTTSLQGSGGVYDLEVYFTNGDIVRLIEGQVVFKAEVTR